MDKLKRRRISFSAIISFLILGLTAACSTKTGCPGEDAQVKLDKKGNPKSKPKSGLFDKKTTKKLGKL